eukprot:TRINITY_DN4823_c0_g1_i6.p1 TRINITY_DN4823_c0_g1~~TRINITY_DN4823_c0_g1_i6.p1  ORF type:complete len:149 (+),score=44.92 TRINITY_DN4823_c0_g1_i6:103-549(+)
MQPQPAPGPTMKRVTVPVGPDRTDVSSLLYFDGEDRNAEDRAKMQLMQLKEWSNQQVNEKRAREALEKEEEEAYIKQTQEMIRKRAIMQEEQDQRRREIKEAVRYKNKMMGNAKKDREAKEQLEALQEKAKFHAQAAASKGGTGFKKI